MSSWPAADVDPHKLGFGVTVFAQVGLDSQAEAHLKAFQDFVEAWPMIRESYMLTGEVDFLLKIVAEDWDAYQKFLTRELTAAPHVAHVRSMLAIEQTHSQPGVPIADDSRLLRRIRENAADQG